MAALNLSLYPPSISSTVEPDHGITLDYADSGKLHRRGLYAQQHYVVTLNWDLLTLAQRDYLEDFILRYRLETVAFTLDGHDYTGELIGGPMRRWVSGQLYGLTAQYRAVRVASVDPIAAIISAYTQASHWYDPSDLSTMWQDTAGTIPAQLGGPVARIDDKGNLGLAATQATAANQPILQRDSSGRTYLDYNGTTHTLVIPTGMPEPTTGICAVVGWRHDSSSGSPIIYVSREGAFDAQHKHPQLNPLNSNSLLTRIGNQDVTSFAGSAPTGGDYVGTVHLATDNAARKSYLNGMLYGTATAPALSDAGDSPTGLLGRNDFLGRIYGVIHIQHGIGDSDRKAIEAWVADKSGAGV